MTFSTGLSALRANQTALSVVGNNIANASTEGYRRQQVLFVENAHVELGGFSIGTGVSIGDIRRAGDATLEAALMNSASEGAMLSAQLGSAKQIESLFLPGTGTLQERAEELFLNLERLSALPTDAALRSSVVHSASGLSDEINRVANELESMNAAIGREIEATISAIGTSAAEAAALNKQIIEIENTGKDAHGLRNQRDLVLQDLAQLIDIQRRVTSDGHEEFLMGGGMFSIEGSASDMKVIRNASGGLELWKEGCDKPIQLGGGKLAGLLAQSNDPGGISALAAQLNEFASALAQHLDAAHAIGVGIGGTFNDLVSTRRVEDASASLTSQETIVPVSAGSLYVSVNDQANAVTTLTEISLDPVAQSLNDIAAQISGIDHVSASVDSLGRISIVAEPGFTFDFTGNLQTLPETLGITGTTVPSVSGRYTGSSNDEYTFRFIGSGTVGVTEGLQVEVLDANNLPIRVLDVGTDYEPLSGLVVGQGMALSLSSGTVADGDTFSVKLPGQPDETGFLAALGLNTLFTGDDAASMGVNPLIAANPSLLATTTNGDPSDTRNLHRMIEVRDRPLMRDGTVTLEQFLTDLAAGAGREVGELSRDVAGHEEHHAFLEAELDAITGVDVNEELARMLQFQRSYQAAARYLASIDQMLQELFGIIR